MVMLAIARRLAAAIWDTPTTAGAPKPTGVPGVPVVPTTVTISTPGFERTAVTRVGLNATPSIVTVSVLFDVPVPPPVPPDPEEPLPELPLEGPVGVPEPPHAAI